MSLICTNVIRNFIVVNVHDYLEYVLNFTAYESIQNVETGEIWFASKSIILCSSTDVFLPNRYIIAQKRTHLIITVPLACPT